jgi:hypothetical protein
MHNKAVEIDILSRRTVNPAQPENPSGKVDDAVWFVGKS